MVERCSDHQVFFTETQTTLCLQLSLEELLNLMQLFVNPPKQKKYTNRRLFFLQKTRNNADVHHRTAAILHTWKDGEVYASYVGNE